MVVGNYQINEPFLKDVFGTFYKGFELKTNESVIIHCVDDTLANDPEFVQTYNDYLSKADKLKVPSLAKTISSGNQNDILYAIYPNKGFNPLKKVLSQNNIFSIFDAPNLLEKIALSIRALHIDGIAHGSLSPECIFVDNKLEKLEIFNTGSESLIRYLIKKYPRNLHKVLPFLSPEILDNNAALQRQSDIYSLGILFYTFLVGHTPWPDTDPESLNLNRDSIVPPSLHRLEIPDFLDSLILDAIESAPEKRCANLSLFLNNLAEAKSNILASFTPTSAMIYGQIEEPAPSESEESQTQEIKTDTSIGIIAIDEPDESDERTERSKDISQTQDVEQEAIDDEPQTNDKSITDEPEPGILTGSSIRGEVDENAEKVNESQLSEKALTEQESILEAEEQSPSQDKDTTSYKEQLLNHENDFFSSEPKPKTNENDFVPPGNEGVSIPEPEEDLPQSGNGTSDKEFLPNGIAPSTKNSEVSLTEPNKLIEKPEERQDIPEILTDVTSVELEKGLKFKTHQTSFPVMQINEFDDRLNFKNYRESQHAKEAQLVQGMPQTGKATHKTQPRQSALEQGPKQEKTVHSPPQYNPSELDDFDEKTATATAEYANEQFNKKNRSNNRIMQNLLKKIGIPLISILSIYLLVLFMIDLGISDGITDIKKNIQNSSRETSSSLNTTNSNQPPKTQKHNNLAKKASLPKKQNQDPIDKLANSINANMQKMSGLGENPLTNLNQQKKPIVINRRKRIRSQPNVLAESQPQRIIQHEENEAQLIIAARSNSEPLVANVYLNGRLYGKTNNQGILSIPNLERNVPYLLRIDKNGYDMYAREINLTRAAIETIDANLARTKTEIDSSNPENLKGEMRQQQRNIAKNNSPKTKSSEKEFGSVNILLNNTEPISDAIIHINGQPWQGNNYEAPAEIQLPSGTYIIEVQKDGYISAPQSYTLDLLNGDYKTVSFILTAF